jgi:hypothetical protein
MSISEFQIYIYRNSYLLGQILVFLGVQRGSMKEERVDAKGPLDGHLLRKNKAMEMDMYTLPLLKTQKTFCG